MAGRRVIQVTIAVLALVLALPSLAAARRDDKPIELFSPGEGVAVKDAAHGLTVDFTCPPYHQEPQDDLLTSGADGYHVILSTSNAVDANRLLLQPGRVDERDAVASDFIGGHCNAAADDADEGLMPTEPGTYYWQAWRSCATYVCLGGVEVSEVRPVIVKQTVCSVNRGELKRVRAQLSAARRALARKATAGRRAQIARLTDRETTLRSRLHVVYRCKA